MLKLRSRQKNKLATVLCFALFLIWACGPISEPATPPDQNPSTNESLIADSAAVVSAHPIASEVGVEILKKGGNAIDAAIAVHFALSVVYPRAGNIGGGGFMIYRETNGNAYSLDYREMAPALAHRDMFLDENGEVDKTISMSSLSASGVPGSIMGMWEAHQEFGSLPWEELVNPSVEIALDGFYLTKKEAEKLNSIREELLDLNGPNPYMKSEEEWAEGDQIVLEELGLFLLEIQKFGPSIFYSGPFADSLSVQMEQGGGHIRSADLESYEAVWRDPIIWDVDEFTFISMGPPSSGGILLAMMTKSLHEMGIGKEEFQSQRMVQMLTEVQRFAYADRASHLGDPDFWDIPLEELISDSYLSERINEINFEKAGSSDSIDAMMLSESEETTHFCVVDKWGNAVSITTTLNNSFGSRILASHGKYFLNNEMDDFSAKPGSPNYYGLIGGEANAIEPGKRMLSSMTPTIVEKEGELILVLGTPGGSTIITTVLQGILNALVFQMDAQSAVSAPRFHHQWLPDVIFAEQDAISEETRNELIELGYTFEEREAIGRLEMIKILPNGKLEAGADHRGDDKANGY